VDECLFAPATVVRQAKTSGEVGGLRRVRSHPDHLDLAQRIFSSVGRCTVVEEHYFNACTALSGRGAAYMYLVIEALADAGAKVGPRRDLALQLVAQTMLGSARMVLETRRHPAALRDDVTTPAGCTIGGLLMLEDSGIRSVLAHAVEEAMQAKPSGEKL
jgi:pyrroline-5-carboxylate reductase